MHTVKVLASLTILLALIIGSSFITNRTLHSTAQRLEDQINKIESSTINGDWNSAQKNLASIEEEWPRVEKTWTVLLDHIEIDNIDTALLRMSKYVETKNSSMALAEIAALRQFIKHIPEKESLSLKNIF
ncbi:MAG: DUF4363 family protein [Bacillota bacterium]